MAVPYVHYPAIQVHGARAFQDQVLGMLDQIRGLTLGNDMLTDIQNSGKQVGIAPFRAEDHGNKCVAHNAKKFVRLRLGFLKVSDGDGVRLVSLSEELHYTLAQAENTGQNRMFLAKQLVRGLTPATVRTLNNLVHSKPRTDRQNEMDQAWAMAQLLEKLANGQLDAEAIPVVPLGQHSLADQLIRILRPWLRPSTGSNVGIYFDPSISRSCAGENTLAWRPPAVGLAHELCHAWRNVTGQRLFDDAQACGLDDDEVMTTGIPPYNFEKYTENKFRAAWTLSTWEKWWHWQNELPMRVNYR